MYFLLNAIYFEDFVNSKKKSKILKNHRFEKSLEIQRPTPWTLILCYFHLWSFIILLPGSCGGREGSPVHSGGHQRHQLLHGRIQPGSHKVCRKNLFKENSVPGSRMGQKSRSGSGIRIRYEHPRSYFRELRNNFVGKKYLNSLMRIRNPGSGIFLTRDPGWKTRIRDKHPRSATTVRKIRFI
jgi:hypothetical protein